QAIDGNRARLRKFIRSRVADPRDAEDVLQDVFHELVETYRMMEPVEQVTASLFRVARNRITDLFRRRVRERRQDALEVPGGDEDSLLELLPSPDAGPEAELDRSMLVDALYEALDELPEEQREVFIAHELEGTSFKELAARLGVGVNTLLSRKRYAVLHL